MIESYLAQVQASLNIAGYSYLKQTVVMLYLTVTKIADQMMQSMFRHMWPAIDNPAGKLQCRENVLCNWIVIWVHATQSWMC